MKQPQNQVKIITGIMELSAFASAETLHQNVQQMAAQGLLFGGQVDILGKKFLVFQKIEVAPIEPPRLVPAQ